jgi:CCR4-NOT transcriptional regulation complex NOT5 subunit
MSEEKRQYLFSKKHEEKGLGAIASERNIQIEASAVQASTPQVNAIEPTIKTNNNNNNTTAVSTATVTNNNFSLMGDEETDLTMRVRNAGDVLYDSVLLSIDKAKRKSVEKAKELATRDISPAAIAAKNDAQDIAALGESVEGIARTFENLMTEIRKKSYSEQVRLLTGYKKLLKEQISVIDSRISMAKRLK